MALVCSKCGRELPDQARFCIHCGKALQVQGAGQAAGRVTAPLPVNLGNRLARQKAVLCAWGAAMLNAIPYVSWGCPLWIVGAGAICAVLYRRSDEHPLTVADGARLGGITGLLAAAIGLGLSMIRFGLLIFRVGLPEIVRRTFQSPQVPEDLSQPLIEFMTTPARYTVFLVTYHVMLSLLLISLASAGGALAARVLKGRDRAAGASCPR